MSLHGTISRYTNNRCRCEACKAAYRAYISARRPRQNELARANYYKHHAERRKAANANAKPRRDERSRWLRRAYGLTEAEVEALFENQGRKCAICEVTESRIWHLDHDHATGHIRGVLCIRCNCGIGYLRDDPELLRKAAAYLLAASA